MSCIPEKRPSIGKSRNLIKTNVFSGYHSGIPITTESMLNSVYVSSCLSSIFLLSNLLHVKFIAYTLFLTICLDYHSLIRTH